MFIESILKFLRSMLNDRINEKICNVFATFNYNVFLHFILHLGKFLRKFKERNFSNIFMCSSTYFTLFYIILIIGAFCFGLRFSKFYGTIFSIVFLYTFLFPVFFSLELIFSFPGELNCHVFDYGSSSPKNFVDPDRTIQELRESIFVDSVAYEHAFRKIINRIVEIIPEIPILKFKISVFQLLFIICTIVVLVLKYSSDVQFLMVYYLVISIAMRTLIKYTEIGFSNIPDEEIVLLVGGSATAILVLVLVHHSDMFKAFVPLLLSSIYAGVFCTNIVSAFLENGERFIDIHWVDASFSVDSKINFDSSSKIDLKNYQLILIGLILTSFICNIIFRRFKK